MTKKFTDEEKLQMMAEVEERISTKKFKFEVLDPTGVPIDKHTQEFEYQCLLGCRIVINVNGWYYYISGDGKYVGRIGPDPEPDVIEVKKLTFIDKARNWVELRQKAIKKQ